MDGVKPQWNWISIIGKSWEQRWKSDSGGGIDEVTKYALDCEQVLLGVDIQIKASLRCSQDEAAKCPIPKRY